MVYLVDEAGVNVDDGLACACMGHIQAAVDFMIARGATDWNQGLCGARQMVAHGARIDIWNVYPNNAYVSTGIFAFRIDLWVKQAQPL